MNTLSSSVSFSNTFFTSRSSPGLSVTCTTASCVARRAFKLPRSTLHLRQASLQSRTSLRQRSATTCSLVHPHVEQKTSYANNILQHKVQHELAFELLQGPLVRYSTPSAAGQSPPTAVLVHGILGSRRNLLSFAKRILKDCPSWQILLVDLRCHGESAAVARSGPNNVQSAASDLLKLLGQAKLFPDMLIGHSFGGKVVLSMAEQFGKVGKTLPKPVQVWVLDTLPGAMHGGGGIMGPNHPAQLINVLRRFQVPVLDRGALVQYVLTNGFSADIANWVATNLQPTTTQQRELVWQFDLHGIAEMYNSYETACLWHLLSHPPQGLKVDFVKAEKSNFNWRKEDEDAISAYGHRVHTLPNAGHWVHADNPEGLFQILAPSFGLHSAR